MRESKFKTWDKTHKKFWDADLYLDCEGSVYEMDGDEESMWLSPTDNFIIVWYTGLKDKNGKEIWEGDVVEKWCHCGQLDRRDPLYNRGIGYYKSLTTAVKWSEQGLNYNIYPHYNDSYWEVIGNIHDNPELLEKK